MAKLQLPTVTLVAVDTAAHAMSNMAFRNCLEKADFGGALYLSDAPPLLGIEYFSRTEFHRIKRCTNTEAQAHYWYTVPSLVRTPHYLIVQWDSGIADPEQWRPEFLDYDYIGAPWGWHEQGPNVGNGGFSLRSRALGNYVAQHATTLPFSAPEDDTLCRKHGYLLHCAGFRFAPIQLASHFAIERTVFTGGPRKHFGFHGMYNWAGVLPEDEITNRLVEAPEWVLASPGHAALQDRLLRLRQGQPLGEVPFTNDMRETIDAA